MIINLNFCMICDVLLILSHLMFNVFFFSFCVNDFFMSIKVINDFVFYVKYVHSLAIQLSSKLGSGVELKTRI
jgi:hypothetical protein